MRAGFHAILLFAAAVLPALGGPPADRGFWTFFKEGIKDDLTLIGLGMHAGCRTFVPGWSMVEDLFRGEDPLATVAKGSYDIVKSGDATLLGDIVKNPKNPLNKTARKIMARSTKIPKKGQGMKYLTKQSKNLFKAASWIGTAADSFFELMDAKRLADAYLADREREYERMRRDAAAKKPVRNGPRPVPAPVPPRKPAPVTTPPVPPRKPAPAPAPRPGPAAGGQQFVDRFFAEIAARAKRTVESGSSASEEDAFFAEFSQRHFTAETLRKGRETVEETVLSVSLVLDWKKNAKIGFKKASRADARTVRRIADALRARGSGFELGPKDEIYRVAFFSENPFEGESAGNMHEAELCVVVVQGPDGPRIRAAGRVENVLGENSVLF